MLLGFSTVRNLALGVKVWDTIAPSIPSERLRALWSHAVMVAVGSKVLTAKLCAGDPDEAFTAGLLHDVGRLILGARFKDAYWTAGAEPVRSIVDVEQAAFGVQHAEVGGWLLEAWGLPPSIVEAARLHHAAPDRPGITALVGATNRLVAATDVAERRLRPVIGIDEEACGPVLEQRHRQRPRLCKLGQQVGGGASRFETESADGQFEQRHGPGLSTPSAAAQIRRRLGALGVAC